MYISTASKVKYRSTTEVCQRKINACERTDEQDHVSRKTNTESGRGRGRPERRQRAPLFHPRPPSSLYVERTDADGGWGEFHSVSRQCALGDVGALPDFGSRRRNEA